MSDRLVTAATFETPEEAHAARLLLESEDIESVVTESSVGGWFWYLAPATGGVKLQVLDDYLPKARKILGEVAGTEADRLPRGVWRCGRCRVDVEDNFTACWSCGLPREDTEDTSPDAPPRRDMADAAPAEDEDERLEMEFVRSRTIRAFRASVIGLFLCPPLLNLYSTGLLISVAVRTPEMDKGGVARFYSALAINALAIFLAIMFLRSTWN